MSTFDIPLAGLKEASTQFEKAASNVVRDSVELINAQQPAPSASTPAPVPAAGGDLATDLIGTTLALASYKANAEVMKIMEKKTDVTLHLIV